MDKPRWFMGIDPGITGALALIDSYNPEILPRLWDLPVVSRKVNKKNRKELDEKGMADLVDYLTETHLGEGLVCVVEHMTPMPNQSSQSGMSLGVMWGQLRMAMTYAGVEYESVRPNLWKGKMGLTSSKDESLFMCLELWPDTEKEWFGPRGAMLDGRCEAALMAYYGMKLHDFLGRLG